VHDTVPAICTSTVGGFFVGRIDTETVDRRAPAQDLGLFVVGCSVE